MERKFVGAGLFAGLVAGIVSFIFARIFIEPQVAKAIEYEEGRSAAEAALAGPAHDHAGHSDGGHSHGGHSHGGEEELFSRAIQENIGAGLGSVVFALVMGAFFAVAFTVLWAYVGRRWPSTSPAAVVGVLGLLGFVAAFAVPFFVYPANPPAVGDDDTIGARSGAFLTITIVSVVAMILAVVVALQLRDRIGGLAGATVAGVGYLVVIAIAAALLPQFHEVPEALRGPDKTIVFPGFPGGVVADFRVYAIANQVVLWTVLTLVFAAAITAFTRRSAQAVVDRVAAAR